MRTIVLFVLLIGICTAPALPACGPHGPGPVIAQTSIDCTVQNASTVTSLYNDLKAKLFNGGTWTAVKNDAKQAGALIGGCALVALVQDYLTGKGVSPDKTSGQLAKQALEEFRAEAAGGATFHTTTCDGGRKVCDL